MLKKDLILLFKNWKKTQLSNKKYCVFYCNTIVLVFILITTLLIIPIKENVIFVLFLLILCGSNIVIDIYEIKISKVEIISKLGTLCEKQDCNSAHNLIGNTLVLKNKIFKHISNIKLVKNDIIALKFGDVVPANWDPKISLKFGNIYNVHILDRLSEKFENLKPYWLFVCSDTPCLMKYIKIIQNINSQYPLSYMERNKDLYMKTFIFVIFPLHLLFATIFFLVRYNFIEPNTLQKSSNLYHVSLSIVSIVIATFPCLLLPLGVFWKFANLIGNSYLYVFTQNAKLRKSNVEVEAFEKDSELVDDDDEDETTSSSSSDTSVDESTDAEINTNGQNLKTNEPDQYELNFIHDKKENYSQTNKRKGVNTFIGGSKYSSTLNASSLTSNSKLTNRLINRTFKRKKGRNTKQSASITDQSVRNSIKHHYSFFDHRFNCEKYAHLTALFRAFISAVIGKCPSLPHNRNPLAVFSSVTNICAIDKEGVLSWSNAYPHKVLVIDSIEKSLHQPASSIPSPLSKNDGNDQQGQILKETLKNNLNALGIDWQTESNTPRLTIVNDTVSKAKMSAKKESPYKLKETYIHFSTKELPPHPSEIYEQDHINWIESFVVPGSPGRSLSPESKRRLLKQMGISKTENSNQNGVSKQTPAKLRIPSTSGHSAIEFLNELICYPLSISHEPNHPEKMTFEDTQWATFIPNIKTMVYSSLTTICSNIYKREITEFFSFLSHTHNFQINPPDCLCDLNDIIAHRSAHHRTTLNKNGSINNQHIMQQNIGNKPSSKHKGDKLFIGIYNDGQFYCPQNQNQSATHHPSFLFSVLIRIESPKHINSKNLRLKPNKSEEYPKDVIHHKKYYMFSCGSPDLLLDYSFDAWDGEDIKVIYDAENAKHKTQPRSDTFQHKWLENCKRELLTTDDSNCIAFGFKPVLAHEIKQIRSFISLWLKEKNKLNKKIKVLFADQDSHLKFQSLMNLNSLNPNICIPISKLSNNKIENLKKIHNKLCSTLFHHQLSHTKPQPARRDIDKTEKAKQSNLLFTPLKNDCISNSNKTAVCETPIDLPTCSINHANDHLIDSPKCESVQAFFAPNSYATSIQASSDHSSISNSSYASLPAYFDTLPMESTLNVQNIDNDTDNNIITSSSDRPIDNSQNMVYNAINDDEKISGLHFPNKHRLNRNVQKCLSLIDVNYLPKKTYPTKDNPIANKYNSDMYLHEIQKIKETSSVSTTTSLTDMKVRTEKDCLDIQKILSHQVLLGSVTSQHPPKIEYFQIIDNLESAFIRFVYFSRQNESRSRVFAERIGLDIGWNCSISLAPRNHLDENTNNLPATNVLPQGIAEIRTHISSIDNVPLLVPLFTDCSYKFFEKSYPVNNINLNKTPTQLPKKGFINRGFSMFSSNREKLVQYTPPSDDNLVLEDTVLDMIKIMQENHEVVICIGNGDNIENFGRFTAADLSVAVKALPPKHCMHNQGQPNYQNQLLPYHNNSRNKLGNTKQTYPKTINTAPLSSAHDCDHLCMGLNTLFCSYTFDSCDNLCLTRIIKKARQISSNLISSCMFMAYFSMYFATTYLIAYIIYIPTLYNAYDTVWLFSVLCPSLMISLLANPAKLKVMDMATPKNIVVSKQKIMSQICFFLGKYTCHLITTLLVQGLILSSLMGAFDIGPNGVFTYPYLNTKSTAEDKLQKKTQFIGYISRPTYHILIRLSQNLMAFHFCFNILIMSCSFVYRFNHVLKRNPLRNPVWRFVVPSLLCVQLIYTTLTLCHYASNFLAENDIKLIPNQHVKWKSMIVLMSVLRLIPYYVWILYFATPFINNLCFELIKRRETKIWAKEQKRIKLNFGTKLGMHSPF